MSRSRSGKYMWKAALAFTSSKTVLAASSPKYGTSIRRISLLRNAYSSKQSVRVRTMWSSSYLLLASEQLLDEVHGALSQWWQVQLALLAQDVEQVELALHRALELAASHGHLFRGVVSPIANTTDAPTSCVLEVLVVVTVNELVLLLWDSLQRLLLLLLLKLELLLMLVVVLLLLVLLLL